MIETTIRDPEKHETVTADSQGRVNLGVDYAAKEVELVVVESQKPESENTSLQQTIGDEPMNEHERKGMLFVRTFGITRQFLKEEHTVETDEDGRIDPDTVTPVDVDWSNGYLRDPGNVARFEFDEAAEEIEFAFSQKLTAKPATVTDDEIDGDPVYRFENDNGETSAIGKTYVDRVQQILGYDPTDTHAHVRVSPEEAPMPVMFRDPQSDAYIAVAPRVET